MLPNKKPLKYGLNLTNSAKKNKPKLATGINNVFGEDLVGENDSREEIEKVNKDIRLLAKQSHNSKKVFEQIQDTLEEDATAFDYDEVYDQMKQKQREVTESLKGTDSKKPRYIQGLLKTAELRKRDRLRAEEKMLEKEREREGEVFADKESFVTTAYKAQQEELKRLEEQDNKKGPKNELGALTGLYANMLESRSKIHEAGILKDSKLATSEPAKVENSEKEQVFDSLVGKKVELNDNNEIIDRRQLLSAGLNVSKKRKTAEDNPTPSLSAYDEFLERRNEEMATQKELKAETQRRRLTQQLQKQLVEKEIETTQEKEDKLKELSAQMARKNDSTAVLSARERYLARKKAAS